MRVSNEQERPAVTDAASATIEAPDAETPQTSGVSDEPTVWTPAEAGLRVEQTALGWQVIRTDTIPEYVATVEDVSHEPDPETGEPVAKTTTREVSVPARTVEQFICVKDETSWGSEADAAEAADYAAAIVASEKGLTK